MNQNIQLNNRYEVKLCTLCIVCGLHKRPKSDLSQNPHHWYFSLIFFALMDSTNKYLKTVPLKIAPKIVEFAESATSFAESKTVFGVHKQTIRYV